MRRCAFSLIEILAILAILAVLAAILFPVFAVVKARAKLTDCQSRLHQFGLALNQYRADHDDQGFVWADGEDGRNDFQPPYYMFEGMRGYLRDSRTLRCPEPNTDKKWEYPENLFDYRALVLRSASQPGLVLLVPPKPVPGTVVAYCANHTRKELDPRFHNIALHVGDYPFVREDASAGIAKNETIKVHYVGPAGWRDVPGRGGLPILRFPGEPWPPKPDQ